MEDVARQAFRVHAHEHVVLAVDLPLDHGHVVLVVDQGAVPDDVEVAERGGQPGLNHSLHQLVVAPPVGDQVGHRDHLQAVAPGVVLQVGHPRHRAVVVEDLADHRGRGEPGEPREVHARLRVPGALEHAAGLGLQGKHVPGLLEVLGLRARVDRHLHRARAVEGGDARGDALPGLDRGGERGTEAALVLGREQIKAQLVAALGGQREADQAARLLGHEVDGVVGRELGRQHEVALVLAVLGVADHDHPPRADLLEGILDVAEGRAAHRTAPAVWAISFSTYLASTSTSRFTSVPGSRLPRVVCSSVSGMRDTQNERSSTLTTVSDTPSTAIEPFSTT